MNTRKRWSLFGLLMVIALLIAIGNYRAQAAQTSQPATMSETDIGKVADAIYKVEGGAKAKVPYGILSVKVANETEARKVCMNTIRNNYVRWQKSSEPNYFNFLANRYCPASADPTGNTNWKKNIHSILGHEFTQRFHKPNPPSAPQIIVTAK